MQRTGRINIPSYRIVVIEHTKSPKAGKFLERVGSYNPKSKQRILSEERIKYWMSVGAQPSDTVHNMLVSAGILNSKKINVLPKKTVAKKEEPAAEAPAAEPVAKAEEAAVTEEVASTPEEIPAA